MRTVWRKAYFTFEAGSLHFHHSHTRKSPSKAWKPLRLQSRSQTAILQTRLFSLLLLVFLYSCLLSSLTHVVSGSPPDKIRGCVPETVLGGLAPVFLTFAFLYLRKAQDEQLYNNSQQKHLSHMTLPHLANILLCLKR